MPSDRHLPGYRMPLIPRGGVHRPKKGRGSYRREDERREVEEGLREWETEQKEAPHVHER